MKLVGPKLVFFTLLSLVLAVTLAGCAQPAATTGPTTTPPTSVAPTTTPATTPSAVSGPYGEMKVALSSFFGELWYPPLAPGSNVGTTLIPMFDSIARPNGRDIAPGVAEKWEVAADGLSWTFSLRKGIKFHNGEDLKADDVKFSIEGYMGSDSFDPWLRDAAQKVEQIDDYTVRVYTKGVQPFVPYMVSVHLAQGIVIPKDYIDQNGVDYFKRKPVGSGPFKFVKHVPGDMIQYEALDKHWRITPEFKKLTLLAVPEESTRVAMLKTGAVDVVDIGIEEAGELEAAGLTAKPSGYAQSAIYLYGTYEPKAAGMPTANVKVRQAMALAIDRDEIIKTFFRGKAKPPMPPLLTENAADIDIAYWTDYAAKAYRYDIDEAKKLLAEAGYPDGISFKLYTYTQADAPYQPKLAQVIQSYWMRAGIKAEIIPTDWGVFKTWRVVGPNKIPADQIIGYGSVHAASERPITVWQLIRGFMGKGTQNLVSTAMPELDKMLDSAQREMDAAKRAKLLAEATKIATDAYVVLPIATAPAMTGFGPKVEIDLPKLLPEGAIGFALELAKHK